jgi:hypothetical protein
MEIEEVSAKIRTGPPVDDEEDYDLPVWAGVVPVATVVGRPDPDPRLREGIALPGYLEHLKALLSPRWVEDDRLEAAD